MTATPKPIAALSPTRSPPTFVKDERGLTTIEYVIILVLIAVGAIAIWKAFGGEVNARIDSSRVSIETMTAETGTDGDARAAKQAETSGNNQSPGVGSPAAQTPPPAAPAVSRGRGKVGVE